MEIASRLTQLRAGLHEQLIEYFRLLQEEYNRQAELPLAVAPYDGSDVFAALTTILDGWPTLGPAVEEVERAFARYLGIEHAIMVSSGGAANLLLFLYFASPHSPSPNRLRLGDEILVPALGWSTTVTPIVATGCVPVFADVHPATYDVDVSQLAELCSPRTRGVIAVHCLGHCCRMAELTEFCAERGLFLVEDCCEALGTRFADAHVGRFGLAGTFSFYFSHHLTSMEGGLIVTADSEMAEALRCMRNNGYRLEHFVQSRQGSVRDCNDEDDGGVCFAMTGFNFKPTSFAAGLLRGQLGRLDDYLAVRARAAMTYTDYLQPYERFLELPEVRPPCRHSWFAYPLLVREGAPFSRHSLRRFLKERGIDSRPLLGGNLAVQPFMQWHPYRSGHLVHAQQAHECGLMIGLHHAITEQQVRQVLGAFTAFFAAP
jgi:CDP-6-deoxy-D-xylo-4-hexulose-3-dehydrase